MVYHSLACCQIPWTEAISYYSIVLHCFYGTDIFIFLWNIMIQRWRDIKFQYQCLWKPVPIDRKLKIMLSLLFYFGCVRKMTHSFRVAPTLDILCLFLLPWVLLWYLKRVPLVLFVLTDGERDGLWLPVFSGHWLSCTGCCQYLLNMKCLMYRPLFQQLSTL